MIGFLLYPISLLPLRILYFTSDFLAFLLYYIFKYRRRVVAENICKSFRALTQMERIEMEKKFYRDLCDNFVETLKLFSISQKMLDIHFKADYSELEHILSENQNCHIYLGHQFNPQWAMAHIGSVLKQTAVVVVVKPSMAYYSNDLFLHIGSRFGLQMASLQNMKKEMKHFSGRQHILVLAGDQNPKNGQKSFWTPFLSQRTAFIRSAEIYTARERTPCFFGNIIREKRGYYRFTLEPIFDFSEPYQTGIITKTFVEKLENAIVSNPQNYLWSHRRWEHIYRNEYSRKWICKTNTAQ